MFPLANWQTWSAELLVIAAVLIIGLMLAVTALAGGSTSKPRMWRYHRDRVTHRGGVTHNGGIPGLLISRLGLINSKSPT